jgi:hypothetical protein
VIMDIEGAEEVALQSSAALLDRIDNLIVDVHPEHCDAKHVLALLRPVFRYICEVTGRRSAKPVWLACNDVRPLPLCTP